MTDYVSLRKLDSEEQCMVLNITAASPCITASSKIYVTEAMLRDLSEEITVFLTEKDLEGYWENDVPGIGGPPCVTLKLLPRVPQEQVLLEIYMELNDGGGFATHNCCFYIRTCRTDLKNFAQGLAGLTDSLPGTTLTLGRKTES